MLRRTILAAAGNARLEQLITHAPVSRGVVARFVGGPDATTAVANARTLIGEGLTVTLDHLGEDTVDRAQADAVTTAYLDLLTALDAADLTERLGPLPARAEVSVKLSAVGQSLGTDGDKIALDNARAICEAARGAGATVTLDAEDHTTTDSTLSVLRELRADFPETGAVLQAYLRRTESDCRDLNAAGSRVRLCKGAYNEPASVAYTKRPDVSDSYRRCIDALLEGDGYPMFATHDPELIAAATGRAAAAGRAKDSFEMQMLFGIRPDEQHRLAADGHVVRVYLPYGAQWYGYLMRRLAEKPANLAFFARALVSKK